MNIFDENIKLLKDKLVFVLAPHTDDGELGCGGTISKLIKNKANVHYFAFWSSPKCR